MHTGTENAENEILTTDQNYTSVGWGIIPKKSSCFSTYDQMTCFLKKFIKDVLWERCALNTEGSIQTVGTAMLP